MGMRWLVEIDPKYRDEVGQFEDVGAESVTVDSGCLIFHNGDRAVYLRSAHSWLTCVPNEEEEA